MTGRIAFVLAGVIALALLTDFTLNGGAASVYMARKLLDLIALVAFWR